MFARGARPFPFAFTSFLTFCVMLFAFAISAHAQGTNATLNGTVTDPSGAVIAGADLTLTNEASGFQVNSTSNDRGEYTFRNLTPGTYDLKVTRNGFQNYVQKGMVLTINATSRADAVLKVGAQTETVTIQGDNSLINYDNGTLQGGADPATLISLPLVVEGKPRSSANLALLLPGVTTGSGNQAFRARINGGLESGDEALMDGATMQQGFMSQSGMVTIHQDFQMSPDMVQEVKVLTSSYDAQYGGSTSGQIAVVTKSGGTAYHGSAFEYGRNKALNAKPWNAKPCAATNPGCDQRPADNEHDFGANIGGPIQIPKLYHGTSKHKSFFYFNWESFHQAGGSSVPTLSIPSLKERSGDFTDWVNAQGQVIPIFVPRGISAGCQGALGAVGPGQQFPGNKIPSACFSPIATAYLALLPMPTNNLATSNFTLSKPVPDTLTSNSNVYMFRIDHNYGESDKFYFTFWRQFTAQNFNSKLPLAISNDRTTNPQNSPIYRFNWEHVFSPKMTNHATLGYLNRNEGDTVLNLDQLGKLPAVAGVAAKNTLPAFRFTSEDFSSDVFEQLSNTADSLTTRPTWVFNDIATRVIGSHTLTFGGEWRNVQGNINNRANGAGTFYFTRATTSNPNVTSGSPVAGFLLGAASRGVVDFRSITSWYPRQKVYVFHVNDSWKVNSKFTLNYGLRWDYYTPSREKFNHYSFIDPVGANPDAGGRPGRLAFAGKNFGAASFGQDFPEDPWHKGFAPRFGMAYSWDQKTVVRAGYGVFFAQAFYPGWGGGMALEGFNLKQTFGLQGSQGIDPAFYLDQGFPSVTAALGCTLGGSCIKPGFDNGRIPTAANGNGSAFRPFDANRRPYSQQWNLTIERQLPKDFFASVAYVGNKGTRLPSSLEPINVLNPFDPTVRALGVKLRDTFAATDTSKDGIPIPYAGWVQQMTSGGGCPATVAQALLPFPQFCSQLLGLNENHGSSTYHSFQLKGEKRYGRGMYMLVSYTLSKLISDASDNTQQLGGTWNATQGVISPFEKQRARSISSDDVPRVLSAAFVYDLPFGKGKSYLNQGGVTDAVLGGWQFSPILRYSSGTPMWFRSTTCQVVPQLRQSCLVGLLPGKNPFVQDPNNYDPTKGPLFDPSAFEPLSNFTLTNTNGYGGPGQFGYTGAGPRIANVRGPNFKDLDFSLTKNTHLTEKVNFQLRFNFFNAFNAHYFIDNGVNNQGSSFAFKNDIAAGGSNGFGAWNGNISPPRTIQIGARLEF